MSVTGWGDVICFIIIVIIGTIGDHLDQDSRFYTCPCYCEVEHEHIRRENDWCEEPFQMAIQDSSALHGICDSLKHKLPCGDYSSIGAPLRRMEISLAK